jgi:hypothetical protein
MRVGRIGIFCLALSVFGCAGGDEAVEGVITTDGSIDTSSGTGEETSTTDPDSTFNIDGSTGCTKKTCTELNADCGPVADGCGGLLDCGPATCPKAGEICGGGGPSKCGVADTGCKPKTCTELDANCGKQGDGCGLLIDCGMCTGTDTCGGVVPNKCGTPPKPVCTPKTCLEMGYNCGPVADGCGGLAMCGTCTTGTCGGGGSPNVCGSSTSPCVKKTCADWGADCGQVSDGCGALTASCGTCTGGNICGGGGVASKCGGAPPTCVKKTCTDYPGNCGPMPDGCGGLTASCGTCTTTGWTCGGGGVASVCGGPAPCTKKTCADFPSGTCGQVSDGCGGLTAICGTCTSPAICGGGGVPSQCGGGGGTSCVNLECKQVTCIGGLTSSISGKVYDPAGNNPLYNVFVYIPNGTPTAFTAGATCDKCADALSGYPLVTAITNEKGEFKLTNVPVGVDIPLVIQTGKWRRQVKITTRACIDTPIDATLTRLPRNKTEGDIPKIALSTGGFDSLECLLRKIGVSDSEFTNPTGTGRVNLYRGRPLNRYPAKGPAQITPATSAYSSTLGGAAFPDATELWKDTTSLSRYDLVLLSCEGDQYGDPGKTYGPNSESGNKSAAALKAMFDYVNKGGRLFASHYHDYWIQNGPGSGSASWASLANWNYPSPGLYNNKGFQTLDENIVTSFPKGAALKTWLGNVAALTGAGQLTVKEARNSVNSIDASRVLEWIWEDTGYVVSGGVLKPDGRRTQYMSFNAPVEATATNQCGRVVFSDIHVSSGDSSGPAFPSECGSVGMSPQEKALEFMLFDLSSRVCDEKLPPPPPTCTPRTCAEQGITCGSAPNGCGGTLACGTCPSGQVCSTGGTCAGTSCTPTTCAALGVECGTWANGCGGTLTCGTCTTGTCGGGGVPGKCGGATCTPKKCTDYGYDCGLWADGCGSTLNCGTCVAPATCGGTGIPGKCGGTGCIKKSCAELGVSCGLSGDGCGGTQDCGSCDGGVPMCTPLSCGGRCGPQGDGCGGVLMPPCPACEGGVCTKTTCSAAGAECGSYPDGCGGLLDCGTCVEPKKCGAAGPNKCGTIG